MRKFLENTKCENFVKTMSVIAATINCLKELVEFSALIPQYLKFYYVILIISLPLQLDISSQNESLEKACIWWSLNLKWVSKRIV